MFDSVKSLLKGFLICAFMGIGQPSFVFASVESLPENNILLKDGSLEITEEDLTRYVESKVPKSERQRILSSADSMLSMLQNIYMTRVLAIDAKQKGVQANVEQLAWEHEFAIDSELVEGLQSLVIKKAQEGVDWDSWSREVYLAESEHYVTEKLVDASHILISTAKRDDVKARALAYEVYEKLQAGASFKMLSDEYSDDKAAKMKDGNLGMFTHKKMVKPFADAAFAMTKLGGISKPVKTSFGYHIIQLNKIKPSESRPFEEVQEKIIRKLKARVAAKTREQLLIDTRSKQGIDVNKELVEKIRNKYVTKINK